MFNSLLADTPWVSYVVFGVLLVVIIGLFIFSSKRRKKQEQEAKDLIEAVKPGNKVKTIGGICGIVVEVDAEENTFVLETGTEQSGKCFIKFDKQAIYQTDAVVEKAGAAPAGDNKEEVATNETAEEVKPEEPFAETAAEDAPAAEAPAEEKSAKKTSKKIKKN